jgi:AraC-like DNA-binding protein
MTTVPAPSIQAFPGIAKALSALRAQGLAIAKLVRASGLSRWQLEDRFRRTVGRSIHEDMLEVRLAEARRLVTTTELPLKAVAARAGFRSIAYMTTFFLRRFDVTPAALRAASRGRPSRTTTP